MVPSFRKTRKKRHGNDGLLEKSVEGLESLVDEKGIEAYLSLVEMFLSFDSSFSTRLLRSGASILSVMKDKQTRIDALKVLLSMGKPGWSVARSALEKIRVISEIEPGFIVQWLRHGHDLGRTALDAGSLYFESSPSVLELLGTERFTNGLLWVRKLQNCPVLQQRNISNRARQSSKRWTTATLNSGHALVYILSKKARASK